MLSIVLLVMSWDIYNARYTAKKLESQATKRQEDLKKQTDDCLCMDSMWSLLEREKREEEISRETIFIRECTIQPQIYSLFGWMIVNSKGLAIGPLLMHQHKDWKMYSTFAHLITSESPVLEGILVCDMDGKKR